MSTSSIRQRLPYSQRLIFLVTIIIVVATACGSNCRKETKPAKSSGLYQPNIDPIINSIINDKVNVSMECFVETQIDGTMHINCVGQFRLPNLRSQGWECIGGYADSAPSIPMDDLLQPLTTTNFPGMDI